MKDNIGLEPAGPFRLITTILDHRKAPVAELAAAYTQRREIENAFDVTQEVLGHLCCRYAIRALITRPRPHRRPRANRRVVKPNTPRP